MISSEERQDLIELLDAIDETVGEPPCKQWPDGFHPEYAENVSLQKMACNSCPVRDMCLEFAMKWEVTGIWGGVTYPERVRLKRASALSRRYRTAFDGQDVA